jgi:hypothetical protein
MKESHARQRPTPIPDDTGLWGDKKTQEDAVNSYGILTALAAVMVAILMVIQANVPPQDLGEEVVKTEYEEDLADKADTKRVAELRAAGLYVSSEEEEDGGDDDGSHSGHDSDKSKSSTKHNGGLMEPQESIVIKEEEEEEEEEEEIHNPTKKSTKSKKNKNKASTNNTDTTVTSTPAPIDGPKQRPIAKTATALPTAPKSTVDEGKGHHQPASEEHQGDGDKQGKLDKKGGQKSEAAKKKKHKD